MSSQFTYLNVTPDAWKTLVNKYNDMPEKHNEACVTYIWIDGTRETLRSKVRTLPKAPKSIADVPKWGFCGYGTYMAPTNADSQRILVPVAMYDDPHHVDTERKHKLVLCETVLYDKDDEYKIVPTMNNTRHAVEKVLNLAKDDKPWFGFEQEYCLLDLDNQPLGWPKSGYPYPMGPYYCGVGTGVALGRDVVEAHYKACLYAGLNICAINGEAMPSQWEFCTGPTAGIEAADEMCIARYLLHRVAEDFSVRVSFDPKPVSGENWCGSGGHCNVSTEAMRNDGGIKAIHTAITSLSKRHTEHMTVYDPNGGRDNQRRMTGTNETASMHEFTSGIEDRSVSVRIPVEVHLAGKGYLEDRRPSANADPYDVVGALIDTICLDGKQVEKSTFKPKVNEDDQKEDKKTRTKSEDK